MNMLILVTNLEYSLTSVLENYSSFKKKLSIVFNFLSKVIPLPLMSAVYLSE